MCGTTDHPEYNPQNVNNDFAILTLCEDVYFTVDISPACLPLPTSTSTQYDNRQAVVSGWGTLSTGLGATVLHEVTVNTMTNTQVIRTSENKDLTLELFKVHWSIH